MRYRTSFIVACALALAGAGVNADSASPQQQGQQQPVTAVVRTELAKKASLDQTLVGYGQVGTDAGHTESLSAPVAGMIATLAVAPGTPVDKGQKLLDFDVAPNVQATYRQAASAVASASEELKRIESQAKLQLATQSQMAAARKNLADAKAAYQAQQQLDAGRRTSAIRAPFAGVVVAVAIHQGDRVQAGAALVQLAHTNALMVALGVEPEDSVKVRPGMPVRLNSVFRPEEKAQGSVVQRQMALDPQTHLVNVLARFTPAAGHPWTIGVPVRGEIVLHSAPEWTLPRNAVLTDKQGAYIYQVKNGKAHLVRVKVESESDQATAIQGGFDPTLPVVVVGNYELHDGMAVREDKQ